MSPADRRGLMVRVWSLTLGIVIAMGVPSTPPLAAGGSQTPLRLMLDKPLEEGGRTRVRLRNTSNATYIYNPYYEACDMVYRALPSRRKFLVPEGTHCDLAGREKLGPGETVTLFRWDLDECIEDNWGCSRARDLAPGRYLMKGWFKQRGADWDRARLFFRIR